MADQATDWAYLAGLIDGEGYIGITVARGNKSAKGCLGRESYRLLLQIAMVDPRALLFAQELTGVGTIRARKLLTGTRQSYVWSTWSRQAADILHTVRPHLLIKGEQADLVLEFQAMMRLPGRDGLTEHEWSERRRLHAAVKALNYGPVIS